jgi:hypothetical protein
VKSRREKILLHFLVICPHSSSYFSCGFFNKKKSSKQFNRRHSVIIIIIIMFTSSFVTATTSSLSSETSSSRFARLHSRPGKRSTLIATFRRERRDKNSVMMLRRTTPSSNNNKRRRNKTNALLEGEEALSSLDVTYPIALLLGLGVGFGIARIIVYTRLQYIAAKFLTLRIFQPDARVLEYDCGNSGRNLYYYPKNVKFVTYKGPEVKGDLLGQISVQAEIPVQIETAAYEKSLSGMREESMDAVVSTGAFTRVLKEKGKEVLGDVLKESSRVLKSDGQAAMIFIEPKSDELMDVLEKNGRALFNPMEVDEKWETLPLFPYLIGTMTKKERGSSSNINSDGEKPKSELQSIRSRRKPKK